MIHRDETETDCFIALGDAFLLVVAATCGRTLERVLATTGGSRRQLAKHREEAAFDREC